MVREAIPRPALRVVGDHAPDERRAELEADGWVRARGPDARGDGDRRDGPLRCRVRSPGSGRRRRACRRSTLPDDDAERGGGEAAAGIRRHPVRAGAGVRQRRRRGGGGRTVRLPGGDEDPVAGHRAQVGDRRRAAERRRCGGGARRLRSADRAREACGTDGTHRRRAGGEAVAGRRGVHPGHPPRSGVRTDRDVRARRHFRRGDEGRGVPSLSRSATTWRSR